MRWMNRFKAWSYKRGMRRRGLGFSKGALFPVWRFSEERGQSLGVRICGLVDPQVEKYLTKHGLWTPIQEIRSQPPPLILCDESALERPEQLAQLFDRVPGEIPLVFWQRQPFAGSLDEARRLMTERFSHFFVSGEITSLAQHAQRLPDFIDFEKYNPVGHGSQNMQATVGLLLPAAGSPPAGWELLRPLLHRWARREDLALWRRTEEGGLSYLTEDACLWRTARGRFDDWEQADANVTTQLLLNLTGEPAPRSLRLQRWAQGQIWLDVLPEEDPEQGLRACWPLEDSPTPLSHRLTRALDEHGWLLGERTALLRRLYGASSLEGQLNEIGRRVLGYELYQPGVSILVVSNKPAFMDKILENFRRQALPNKELVVVFHCSGGEKSVDLPALRAKIKPGERARVFARDADCLSFGYCINDGISLTKMEYVAKFDDDDHYAPHFLTDLLPAFSYCEAQVCGRLTFHTYLEEKQCLVVRKPGNEYTYCTFLPGATLLIHRDVFQKAMFRDIPRDIDGRFGVDCTKAGIRMFSADGFQLLVMRASDKSKHTWKASDSVILRQSLPVYPGVDQAMEEETAYFGERYPACTVEQAVKQISI